jgi:hypothetical protein
MEFLEPSAGLRDVLLKLLSPGTRFALVMSYLKPQFV